VLGLGIGGLFPLALTLPLDYSADPEEAARLTAMAFFVGYIVAAVGPVEVGALRDATGGYAIPFGALASIGVVMLVVSSRFRPQRHGSLSLKGILRSVYPRLRVRGGRG
jgi:CP family cyanate transporter-like MFS transporter